MAHQTANERLANDISEGLNHVGMLAVPAALRDQLGEPPSMTWPRHLRERIASLVEALGTPGLEFPSREPLAQVQLVTAQLLELIDRCGLTDPAVVLKARAVIDAMGLGHPSGWAAAEAEVERSLADARERSKRR